MAPKKKKIHDVPIQTSCEICNDPSKFNSVQKMKLRGRSNEKIAKKLNISLAVLEDHLSGKCVDISLGGIDAIRLQMESRLKLVVASLDKLLEQFTDSPGKETSYPLSDMMSTAMTSLEKLSKVKTPDQMSYEILMKVVNPMMTGMARHILMSAKNMRNTLPEDNRSAVDDFMDNVASALQGDLEWCRQALGDVLNGRKVSPKTA